MSESSEFRYLLEEVRVFNRNLNKDNAERRKDSRVIEGKFIQLDKLRQDLVELKELFNSSSHEPAIIAEVKSFVDAINKNFDTIKVILDDRLANCNIEVSQFTAKMSEKFDLRTATSLLPVMDDTESVTLQLIDAIELYDTLLNDEGKKLLTTYVLKARLSQNAKIRLNKSYESNADLIADMKQHLLTKKSAAALSTKLNNAKQGGKSINDFGKVIEELLVDLTITQAGGNNDALQTLRTANEKIAINVFANGLHNSELRTIVKARNYSKLSDAICGAKDEEVPQRESHQVFHVRGNSNFRRGRGFANGRNHAEAFFQNSLQVETERIDLFMVLEVEDIIEVLIVTIIIIQIFNQNHALITTVIERFMLWIA